MCEKWGLLLGLSTVASPPKFWTAIAFAAYPGLITHGPAENKCSAKKVEIELLFERFVFGASERG